MSELVATGFQLSPQQKHLWLLGAEEASFHATVSVGLRGKLDVERLKAALEAVIARHEALRTTFERRPGMKVPVQVVHESLPAAWDQSDLRSLPPNQQNPFLDQLFQQEQATLFSLGRGPMVRAKLLVLAEDHHVLMVSMPSLAVDAVSLCDLFEELAASYAFGRGSEEEVFQYADFSAWQNQLLEETSEEAAAGREFWSKLGFATVPALKLPFEARPQEIRAFAPGSVRIEFPADRLRHLEGDLASFLACCWHVLGWRLTGQTEIVTGVVADGRHHEELAGAIGLFQKTLPLVCRFEAQRSFDSLREELGAMEATASSWQDYLALDTTSQDLPTTFLVEQLAGKRSAGGVQFSVLRQESVSQRFRLQLRLQRSEGVSKADLRYDPQFFSRPAAERIATSLAALAASAAENPQGAIGSLPLMNAEGRRKVVVGFNQTATEYVGESCIHYDFEKQAQRWPERLALRSGDVAFTYNELNARSNQLAHLLSQHGVKANTAVGLAVDRSAEMVIGLLGILKSGGAYVPLVPDNPKARLHHQLADTKAPVLITEQKFLDRLPEFAGSVICLDRHQQLLARQPSSNPAHINAPDDRVYVIYTSGSTGVPKGVVVSHLNLANYTRFICQKLRAEVEPLNFATVSTLAADLGNTAIFPALVSGGCLHVIPYETAMAGNLFADYGRRYPLDVLKITPSHLGSLLSAPGSESLLPRKYLILGGEALSWELARQVEKMGRCSVINHYGPTEATVGCCTFVLQENDVSPWAPATVPIGRPIGNAQVYILDEKMQPVAIGVSGELAIGGAGVAQGYLNQAEQTSERFVADGFSQNSGGRIYHTGDLARFLPDGNVEFLGRIDQQVKIRGFRVEPAEIEAVLKESPAISQAVVLPLENQSGEKRLVAYVVARQKPAPSSQELRSWVESRLPDYMVPSSIINLDRIPLTANGKVDRSQLPSPDQAVAGESIYVAPRNPVEQGLTEIWGEVLGLKQVGIHDNFFDLGGHSLLATQVISRVRSTFRVQLPLRSLFETPTVEGLATQIGQLRPDTSEDEEVARLLRELEGLSDEEAERLLANELERGATGSESGNG